MSHTTDITIPAGHVACWDCRGTKRIENPYAHDCVGPLCQDPDVIQCTTCDGRGHLPDGD
ncbi:hypothetical protein [Streptomyces sp. NPDC057552]|uniref:hypothetical protein n=1 Tax=Streptomyces sp. NPDC057552 TaxID=3350537 RepID=UPI0036AB0F6A